jgi:response regulator of citrate/malate metabolism
VSSRSLRVLVVDDEPITAAAHAEYVGRLSGFEVAGIAGTGSEALRLLRESVKTDPGQSALSSIDLVLLDMNLPDFHGIELCRRIRSTGLDVDIIAITAVRDVAVVRAAVSFGIVLYLIKPFTFTTFAAKLDGYRKYTAGLGQDTLTTQSEVDASFAMLRSPGQPQLDKGLSAETLDTIVATIRDSSSPASAGEIAAALSLSRVTARRYLEHLFAAGVVERVPRYGSPGRPELEYRWRDGE